MKTKDFLDSFVFIVLCLFTLALLAISFEGKAYEYFYQKVLLHPNNLFYWAVGVGTFTMIYGSSLYLSTRGSFLVLKMKNGHVQMEQKMLEDLVDCVTKKNFSDLRMKNQVAIQDDNTLEITAETDPIDFKRHKVILKKLEQEISKELHQTLSYKKPFTLNLKMR